MNCVADVIRDDIKVMTAYQVADLPEGFIKLDGHGVSASSFRRI